MQRRLVNWAMTERFGMGHHVSAKLLVVDIPISHHKLNGTHLFHSGVARFLEYLEVCDGLPILGGEATFVGSGPKGCINFGDNGITRACNEMGER